MSGPYLAANNVRLTACDVELPYYGAAVADVTLSTGAILTSPVTLTVGNLSLTMALALDTAGKPRQRSFAGVTTARLIGGAGSWSTRVRLAPYRNPAGVLLSSVLRDLASATGTTTATRERAKLATGLDRSLGVLYVPEAGAPASRLLGILAGALWWVDPKTGETRIAATRESSSIRTPASVEHVDGGKGLVRVATEDVAAWVPGATYTSPTVPAFTVTSTRIHAGNDGTLRLEVMTS